MSKISILMGVYNPKNEAMLKNAVYSILKQSFEDFELIICNDCSSSEAKKWIIDLKNEDGRIVYIENEKNMGLAYSLNRCLEKAQGEYIARQDADDYSDLGRLEEELNFLESNKEYAFVGSSINLFNDNGVYSSLIFPENPVCSDFLFTSPFNHGSIMMRKAVLDIMNGYTVSARTLRCEDYDLFMRMYIKGYKGYNIKKPLYYYREDDDAVMRRKFRYRIDEALMKAKYFKIMGIGPKRYFYIMKPLIAGLMPKFLVKRLRNEYYKNRRIKTNGR